jgi:hypothetical protein
MAPREDDQDWRIDIDDLQRRLSAVNTTEWKVSLCTYRELMIVYHFSHVAFPIPVDISSHRRMARSSTRFPRLYSKCRRDC